MTRAVLKAADPMPAIRKAAMATVDGVFNQLALESLHRDHAHASKRAVVVSGQFTPEFLAEAGARGISPADLAILVLSKPDNQASRELARQKIMLSIERAATPAEIDGILANVNLGI